MKLLIVSDSHGHNELLDNLITDYKDVDIFLHAGDSEVPSHTLYPFRVVKGNCDYYFETPKEYIIPTPFGNLLIRHKEEGNEKYMKDHDIKFYVYGHSHVKACKKKNGICYINPGSIVYPRDGEASFVILEIEEEDAFVTFIELETRRTIKKYHVYMGDPNTQPVEEKEEIKDPMANHSIEDVIGALQNSEELRQEIKDVVKEEIDSIEEGE